MDTRFKRVAVALSQAFSETETMHAVVWIPRSQRAIPGKQIRLPGSAVPWIVESVYEESEPADVAV